jgi:polyisoprenoid-binding protein YceI
MACGVRALQAAASIRPPPRVLLVSASIAADARIRAPPAPFRMPAPAFQRTRRVLGRLAAAALVPAALAAARLAPRPHDVDKAHSEINFVAESRMLSAHGFFGKWDADVLLDPEAPEQSSVSIRIDAASINTRVERRDAHLRSADFFDVEKHPQITFVSKGVKRVSATQFDMTGDLTMRGVTRSIVVPTTVVFYDNGLGRFKGAFTVKRKQFGIAYDSRVNPIEDDVQVQFNMSLRERKTAR